MRHLAPTCRPSPLVQRSHSPLKRQPTQPERQVLLDIHSHLAWRLGHVRADCGLDPEDIVRMLERIVVAFSTAA